MKKIYGMSIKDWEIFGKIMNPKKTNYVTKFETVEEYIKSHPDAITSRRVSKKGVELVEVTYHTGKVTEYPVKHLSNTTAFEY